MLLKNLVINKIKIKKIKMIIKLTNGKYLKHFFGINSKHVKFLLLQVNKHPELLESL